MEIKEKKVELIELFYDLIFVYAISRMTALMEESSGGVIPLDVFLRYFVVCFTILQAWLYMTNYINRYGQWEWYEYALSCVNMIAVIYMANTLSLDWNSTVAYLSFSLAMLCMLACVALLYSIQILVGKKNNRAAKNSLMILCIVCAIYLLGVVVAITIGRAGIVVIINAVAILCGAFLPFFLHGQFDADIISFPHLVERFELLTIITFGEAVVGMTGYFDTVHFSVRPILVFMILLSLFGCYVVQIHHLMEHMSVERGLCLMFSHYFIVISINLITIILGLVHRGGMNPAFINIVAILALLLFFTSLMTDSRYYKKEFVLTFKDVLLMAAAILLGSALMLGSRNDVNVFFIGILLASALNFGVLLHKYKSLPCKNAD